MFVSIAFVPSNSQGSEINFSFYSEGSIVVDFTVYFRGFIDPLIATAPLKQAIESGKLGDFSVSKNSFAIMQPTPKPTGGYNHTSTLVVSKGNCPIIFNHVP